MDDEVRIAGPDYAKDGSPVIRKLAAKEAANSEDRVGKLVSGALGLGSTLNSGLDDGGKWQMPDIGATRVLVSKNPSEDDQADYIGGTFMVGERIEAARKAISQKELKALTTRYGETASKDAKAWSDSVSMMTPSRRHADKVTAFNQWTATSGADVAFDVFVEPVPSVLHALRKMDPVLQLVLLSAATHDWRYTNALLPYVCAWAGMRKLGASEAAAWRSRLHRASQDDQRVMVRDMQTRCVRSAWAVREAIHMAFVGRRRLPMADGHCKQAEVFVHVPPAKASQGWSMRREVRPVMLKDETLRDAAKRLGIRAERYAEDVYPIIGYLLSLTERAIRQFSERFEPCESDHHPEFVQRYSDDFWHPERNSLPKKFGNQKHYRFRYKNEGMQFPGITLEGKKAEAHHAKYPGQRSRRCRMSVDIFKVRAPKARAGDRSLFDGIKPKKHTWEFDDVDDIVEAEAKEIERKINLTVLPIKTKTTLAKLRTDLGIDRVRIQRYKLRIAELEAA